MKLVCRNGHEGESDKFEVRPDELTCPDCGERRGTRSQMKPGTPLRPVSEKKQKAAGGKPVYSTMKRSQPERDWALAREKVDTEAACRFCGKPDLPRNLEACHVDGRDRDRFDAATGELLDQPWPVAPDRIVPGHRDCHAAYDRGEGPGLLGKLTLEEEIQAVRDFYPPITAGRSSGSGISQSIHRLDPASRRAS